MKKNEIIIIGYSGHSYVCIENAIKNKISVIGYCDLNKKKINPYNLQYFGSESELEGLRKVFISIADNTIRRKIYENSSNLDFDINLIHPTAILSNNVKFGCQILVNPASIINPNSKIGNGCIINTGSIIEHDCFIDDFCHIAPGSVLCGGVSVGKNSFIGANSTIKQGVKIGNNVTVGAGAVVINNVDDGLIVVGNPSKKNIF